MSRPTPPPFDPELAAALIELVGPTSPSITPEMIPLAREGRAETVESATAARDVVFEHHVIPGPAGDIELTSFRRADHTPGGGAVYYMHGGGMIMGTRFGGGLDFALEWVEKLDVVAVTVEYRLAPEHPDPAPLEDCYAGLQWAASNARELEFDPAKLVVAGASAGGGLAAGVALMTRDLGGAALAGQVLIYPMLDDRNTTVSSHQINGIGVWDRNSNDTGWDAYLGERRHRDDVSIYAVPARATDLTNLPPAYIDCGSAEVFRDEDVAYATRIWHQGGVAELHVWPGGFHGFDGFAPTAVISQASRATRTAWLRRLLA
ncbi:MAG: alpha/beta hydrolase fold domain-containing protein [Actinomycetota bacterium]